MSARTPFRPVASLLVLATVAALLVNIGCRGESSPTNSANSSGPRIVSLSPAITQMLDDLGRSDDVVGVGEFDPVAPPRARIVGDLRAIDYEALLAVEPTAVLLQPGVEGVPDRLASLAERLGFQVHSFDIETLDDALTALTTGVGEAAGDSEAAAGLAERVRSQMQEIASFTDDLDRPRVLLAVGLSPYVTAAAPGTFLDEALAAAGGRNAVEQADILYPEFDHERLLALDPDVIVYMTSRARDNAAVDLPEPLAERLVVLEDEAALLPSTSLPRVTAQLAGLIHAEVQEEAAEVVRLGNAGGGARSDR